MSEHTWELQQRDDFWAVFENRSKSIVQLTLWVDVDRARLIVAAPELLAALEGLIEQADLGPHGEGYLPDEEEYQNIAIARAAITKAKCQSGEDHAPTLKKPTDPSGKTLVRIKQLTTERDELLAALEGMMSEHRNQASVILARAAIAKAKGEAC